MLQSIILLMLSIFSVLGIMWLIKTIVYTIHKQHNSNACIVIGVRNHQDSVEGIVRLIMRQHPNSEILIIDYGSEDETGEIIKKLANDYTRISVKRSHTE